MAEDTVAGEPIELLVEAFGRIRPRGTKSGMSELSVSLEPRLGYPFRRALMRVEAELMLRDADALGQPEAEDRSYHQRAADAFVALVLRVGDAVAGSSGRQ